MVVVDKIKCFRKKILHSCTHESFVAMDGKSGDISHWTAIQDFERGNFDEVIVDKNQARTAWIADKMRAASSGKSSRTAAHESMANQGK